MAKPAALTKKIARKAMRWFQKRMGITDWRVYLDIQDDPPSWRGDTPPRTLASCEADGRRKEAQIWVSNARNLDDGTRPLANLFHEGMHIVETDIGLAETNHHTEFAWSRLGEVLADLYELTHRKKK